MQGLQIDDVILIFLPALYCGFGRRGSKGFTIELYFDHFVWL